MPTVLGFDSSTQSLSALLLCLQSGEVIHTETVNFGADFPQYGAPSGFIPGGVGGEVHADPRMWLDALDLLLMRLVDAGLDLSGVVALSGSGQQHGSVYLRDNFEEVVGGLRATDSLVDQIAPCFSRSTSPIWMDSSTSTECAEIAEAMGGADQVCARSGSIPVERFTGPQIRRFWKTDEAAWKSTAVIHLVSSFMASILAGKSVAIDEGDGAGMNLMNLASGDWDQELLEVSAPGLGGKLPSVSPSGTAVGAVSSYFSEKYGLPETCQVVLFSGDNPCSLVGMGAATPGKVVISLGTSDTLFAAMPEPRTDPAGCGHAFGNPMGGYMSLICFKNGSLAREKVKEELGLSWDDFEQEALAETPVGNEGRVMIPFYEPEITPRVNEGGVHFIGWPEGKREKGAVVRALLEGQFANMWLHSRWLGVEPQEIYLTGGASQNDGIAQVVADVFEVPVTRLVVSDSAALGAAIRAAVATGNSSLAELEERCCRPEEIFVKVPQEGAETRVAELRENFRQALATTYSIL